MIRRADLDGPLALQRRSGRPTPADEDALRRLRRRGRDGPVNPGADELGHEWRPRIQVDLGLGADLLDPDRRHECRPGRADRHPDRDLPPSADAIRGRVHRRHERVQRDRHRPRRRRRRRARPGRVRRPDAALPARGGHRGRHAGHRLRPARGRRGAVGRPGRLRQRDRGLDRRVIFEGPRRRFGSTSAGASSGPT